MGLHSLEFLHLASQGFDLLAQVDGLGLRDLRRIAIRHLDGGEVFINAVLDLPHPLVELGLSEVAVVCIDRLELAAVDGHDGLGDGGGSLVQDSAGDIVFAGDDDDRVVGGLGDDYIDGGLANDTLTGHGGNDVIDGGDGNDTLQGDGTLAPGYFQTVDATQHGNDVLDGGAGNDDLFGGGKDDGLFGGIGNDKLWGDDATEADLGGIYHGSDYLDGGDGIDQLVGGGGSDILVGGIGADVMFGDMRPGITLSAQYLGDDILYGDAGDDLLEGGGVTMASTAVPITTPCGEKAVSICSMVAWAMTFSTAVPGRTPWQVAWATIPTSSTTQTTP